MVVVRRAIKSYNNMHIVFMYVYDLPVFVFLFLGVGLGVVTGVSAAACLHNKRLIVYTHSATLYDVIMIIIMIPIRYTYGTIENG